MFQTNPKFEILRQRRAPKAHPPLAEIRLRRTISKRLEFGKLEFRYCFEFRASCFEFISIDFVGQ